MISSATKVQVNLPLDRIGLYGELFARKGLAPEIGLGGAALDQAGEEELRAWGRAFADREITAHGPFIDLSPGSLDPKILAVTRRRLAQAHRAASLLGVSVLVCHAGYEYRRYPHDLDRWVETSVQTWRGLLESGEGPGIVVALENVYERDPEPIRRVLAEAAHPRLRACFDTGHFNVWSRQPLEEWLTALGPHLARLHLHDNDGSFDQHLPIGQGGFDFRGLFGRLQELGLSPGVTLEPHGKADFFPTFRAFQKLAEESGKPF